MRSGIWDSSTKHMLWLFVSFVIANIAISCIESQFTFLVSSIGVWGLYAAIIAYRWAFFSSQAAYRHAILSANLVDRATFDKKMRSFSIRPAGYMQIVEAYFAFFVVGMLIIQLIWHVLRS